MPTLKMPLIPTLGCSLENKGHLECCISVFNFDELYRNNPLITEELGSTRATGLAYCEPVIVTQTGYSRLYEVHGQLGEVLSESSRLVWLKDPLRHSLSEQLVLPREEMHSYTPMPLHASVA